MYDHLRTWIYLVHFDVYEFPIAMVPQSDEKRITRKKNSYINDRLEILSISNVSEMKIQ